MPKTLEALREPDVTTVVMGGAEPGADPDPALMDEETHWDINHDEFQDYFAKAYTPKVLITSADNPHSVSESESRREAGGEYLCGQEPAHPCGRYHGRKSPQIR